jgi:hypothetical protein
VDITQVVVEQQVSQPLAPLVLEMAAPLQVAHQRLQLLTLAAAVMLRVQFLDLLAQAELLL